MWAFHLGFKDTQLTQHANLQTTVCSHNALKSASVKLLTFDVHYSNYSRLCNTEQSIAIKKGSKL